MYICLSMPNRNSLFSMIYWTYFSHDINLQSQFDNKISYSFCLLHRLLILKIIIIIREGLTFISPDPLSYDLNVLYVIYLQIYSNPLYFSSILRVLLKGFIYFYYIYIINPLKYVCLNWIYLYLI